MRAVVHQPPRGAGGARGPGAARPAGRQPAGPDRGPRGRDQLRRSARAVGVYPDAPKLPSVVGYEVAGTVESVGEGVDVVAVGDRVMAGDPVRRPRRAGHGRRAATSLPLPDGAELRAGRRRPGQLRDRLRGRRPDGRAARGRPAADPRRGGRRRDLRDPDRRRSRGGDLRHRVRLQARRDPRPGRRPRDRLPQRGLRGRSSTGSPTARASTSPSTRSARPASAATTGCCGPAAG